MGSEASERVGQEALQELVVSVLARMERDGSRALDEACREHPDLAPVLRRRVKALREFGLLDAWSSDDPPERLGDFRLLRRLGAGGMGVVYHAIQESLGRDVALKLIRPEMLYHPGARERFARETTIIARLQHPGIVPIYTVGGADELPYYAMERVPGCTLAEALAELRDRHSHELTGADLVRAIRARTKDAPASDGPESSLFAGTWEQTVLRIVRAAAEALEHAHGRGVLHRDLKPSNVMVTAGGRVMLVDFGLSQTEGGESVTRSGDRAGSLPYMPPELLQDGLRAVGKRSDLYSLGVTLYQMLTLQLPYAGASEMATLASILEGRPRPVRALAPRTSWEAETVCLAAMERDPARRYATAADLARDLENALERRPVEARRASPWLRTRRWVQRRPGAAAALVLAVLLPTGIAVVKANEVRRVGDALNVAQEQKTLATTNFERAMRAIDSMLRRVGDESLDHVPGSDSLRAELLGEARSMYAELERERPDDLHLAALGAEAALLRAGLLQRQRKTDEVAALLRETLARIEPHATGGPFDLRHLHARGLVMLANAVPSLDEAGALRKQGLESLDDLRRERPDDANVRKDFLEASMDAVIDARRRGERKSPPVDLDELEKLARDGSSDEPGDASHARLARVLSIRGFWFGREGRPEAALAPSQEALQLRQRILALHPEDETARQAVVESASMLSQSLLALRRPQDALPILDLASEECERNHADFPDVFEYATQVADVAINRGVALGQLGLDKEARRSYERAAEVQREIVARHPEIAQEQRTLGTILLNIAGHQVGSGEAEKALETCADVRERFALALSLAPDDSDIASWRALERMSRSGALLRLERIAEAAEAVAEGPALAAHRTGWASDCLKRMATCLERARASGDAQTVRCCEASARQALDLALARGDLGSDPRLAHLREMLDRQ